MQVDPELLSTRWEVIIIGSGAAGACSALGLQGKRVLMLDIGILPPANPLPNEPLYDLREKRGDLHEILLGSNFESLTPVSGDEISPKLKGPFIRFISERPATIPADQEHGFKAVQSFALGGLANAWGAGVLRYNSSDLKGFPISVKELEPLYDELTERIGINGATDDDLTGYLGSPYGLQPPFPLSPIMGDFMRRYEKKREQLRSRGVSVGRIRAAILSQPLRNRKPYEAFGQDFFWGPQEAIYSPLFTIKELISAGSIRYQPSMRVTHFKELQEEVVVYASDVKTEESYEFRASKVMLAAGALNSARITLASFNDTSTKLPLLDNPVTFIPVVDPWRIGSPLQTNAFIGGELAILFPGESVERPLQGSIYGLLGPLRTDLLREFPLSMRSNLVAGRYLVPALLMVQMFYPDQPSPKSWLKLNAGGGLQLTREGRLVRDREGDICKILRKMGYLAFEQLCVRPIAGSSIHYAGTLAMSASPQTPYSTDKNGRLEASKRVYIADAATFPSLPAKNHSFTLMANALRIGRHVKETLNN